MHAVRCELPATPVAVGTGRVPPALVTACHARVDRRIRSALIRLTGMPDRCEVLPGDSVVARRGGGLLWVDAPGSPALVAALHACLGVAGPGADRVLAAVAGQVSRLADGPASFALVLSDTSQAAGTGHATGIAL